MNATPHTESRTEQRAAAARAPANSPSSLPEEHALLMRETTLRAQRLLGTADEGQWPHLELQELLNYLRLEVLRQIVDTEWLLFRTAHHAPDDLAQLRRDHLALRETIEVLAQAAATAGTADGMSPPQLAATTRDLLGHLERHLAAEEDLLATAGAAAPGTASLGSKPHEWYELIEGPTIDLDLLSGEQAEEAVRGRLLRLRPGEQVEVRCSTDPSPLWQSLLRADPGGYGVCYLEQSPLQWRVEITRHPGGWSPHPFA